MSLPTGVLTFCFTDIEGSTELWEQEPAAMAQALVWHDQLVAKLVERHDGYLIQSMGEGDSTVSVFSSASSAVTAAVDIQRELRGNTENELGLAVRVGLHTGEAEQRDGSYFGAAVILAARVRGLADGGHVFLSSATRAQVMDRLPAGCTLVDLGPHTVKGLAAREEVYALSASDLPPPPSTACPYQGLLPFGPGDGDRFFGRDRAIADAAAMLRADGWLTVVGSSGSGKSSLLRAGVATRWEDALVLTPGAAPTPLPPGDGLVVVDQLEELWTVCADPEARVAFIDSLLARAGPVAVGIRADFYGRCGDHAALRAAVAGHQLLLGAMDEDELRSAITGPAQAFGLRVEAGLVEVLVREVAGRPGALPLLSHALLATWERRDGHTLTLDAYREVGGVGAAIAETAESVYGRLDAGQRSSARNVLLRLVEPGEGAEDARRRAGVDEIVSGAAGTSVTPVIDALAAARLLIVDEGSVELAHEALIREWPRLREWLDEEREALAIQRHLTGAAAAWERLGKDPNELYRGPRLAALLEWLTTGPTLSASEREFAETSRAESERIERARARSTRRLRILVAGVSVALLVALVAGAFALIQQHDAASSRDRADISRLAAVSRSVVERQPDLGLLLAVAAFDLEDNDDTRSALLNGLQANPLLLGLLHGVDSGLEAAVFSPDGRTLATPTSDGTGTILWSTASHHRLAVLDKGDGIALGAAISPDGRWLAVPAIYEKPQPRSRLQIWDLERERLVHLLPSPAGALSSAAFSADGRSLFTQGGPRPGPFGTEVVTWDTRTWKPRGKPLVVNPEYVGDRTVAVSADGGLIAVPESRGGTEVWATASRRPVGELAGTAPAQALAFSPSGKTLAVGDETGDVHFFDPRSAAERAAPISLSESSPSAIEFTPTGDRVAIGRIDGRTQIFEVASGEALGPPLGANAAAINDVSFTADGALLATAGLDRTGALWRLDGDRAIGTELGGQGGAITDAVFTPDGGELLTASTDGSVAARDPESGSIDRRFELGGEALTAAVSPDGSTVAAGGTSGTVELWPAGDPDADPLVVDLDRGWAQQVAYAPDGGTLAIAVDNQRGVWEGVGPDVGHVRFVDPDTGEETAARLVFRGGPPIGVAYSPDGDTLAVTVQNNLLVLYDAVTHDPLGDPIDSVDSAFLATAFSPDSQRFATGTTSGRVIQWNTADRREIEPSLEGDVGAIAGVAYSPDGKLLATTRLGFSTTQLWQADDGAQFGGTFVAGRTPYTERTFTIHHFVASRPAFSPKGDRLVTPGFEHATVSWTLDPEAWRRAACAIAGRDLTEAEWNQFLPARTPRQLCEGN